MAPHTFSSGAEELPSPVIVKACEIATFMAAWLAFTAPEWPQPLSPQRSAHVKTFLNF